MVEAVWLTLKLATVTTVLLLLLATPLAWGLARGRSSIKPVVGALVALPIVLPPTVLGFYLLIALGPESPLMALFRPFAFMLASISFTLIPACTWHSPAQISMFSRPVVCLIH